MGTREKVLGGERVRTELEGEAQMEAQADLRRRSDDLVLDHAAASTPTAAALAEACHSRPSVQERGG